MAALFSTLATTAGQWSRPDPDYGTLTGTLGHAAASNRTVAAAALVNSAAHSPIVVAFQLTADREKIYVGYNPTLFPADLHNPTPFGYEELETNMVDSTAGGIETSRITGKS